VLESVAEHFEWLEVLLFLTGWLVTAGNHVLLIKLHYAACVGLIVLRLHYLVYVKRKLKNELLLFRLDVFLFLKFEVFLRYL